MPVTPALNARARVDQYPILAYSGKYPPSTPRTADRWAMDQQLNGDAHVKEPMDNSFVRIAPVRVAWRRMYPPT